MKKLTKSIARNWPSGYGAGEILKDFPVAPGTYRPIGAHLVTEVTSAARASSPNGGRSSGGIQYLNDPVGEPYALVLSSYSEDDIAYIPRFMVWQKRNQPTRLCISGMKIFVVPSESVLKLNPFAQGAEFRLG